MLQPTRNLVSIRPKFESDKIGTSSGIILYKHTSYSRRTTQGIVKLVGPSCREDIMIGDYVFYSAYDGTLWYDKGEILILLPDDKVLGKAINIPETAINGLFVREKIDKEKNYERLFELLEDFQEFQGNHKATITADNFKILEFITFIKDKVDSYGAYFECPMDKAIELIVETVKEADWARGIEVGGTYQTITDLYKDEKRVCEYCGGKMRLMEKRKEATVFYQCESCGTVKDRRMVKGVSTSA